MEELLGPSHCPSLWREIEREFHAARARGDADAAGRCLRYAAWTLHPAPQARSVSDVSEPAARLFHAHAADLHQWIDRHDFITAQKGLRFHLSAEQYAGFEAQFLEKTARYPARPKRAPG